jgi:NADPH:quinone reductase-like Zn-dependent oxidoreductase
MQAAFYSEYGAPSDVLSIKEQPKPTCGKDDVLVKIMSASVNPVDWKLMAGYIPSWAHEAPFIPGWDLAGVVAAVGEGVTAYKVGDEVFSYHRPEFDTDETDKIGLNGCIAEFAAVPQHRIAPKPTKASWNEAASIPLAALTAYQGLHDYCKITAGQTVLVTGGSGGVGGFGVQIAKAAGATVISTCSAKNIEYVKGLGADHVIDYTVGPIAEQVKALFPDGVDAVYDSIGGDDTLQAICKAHSGVKSMLVKPSSAQLTALAKLFDEDKLKSKITVFKGINSTVEAMNTNMGGRVVGKLVIEIASA